MMLEMVKFNLLLDVVVVWLFKMLDLQIWWIISLISCSFNSRLPSLESLAFPPCSLGSLLDLSHHDLAFGKVVVVDLWGCVL